MTRGLHRCPNLALLTNLELEQSAIEGNGNVFQLLRPGIHMPALQDVCVRGCWSPPRKGQPSEQVGRARARGWGAGCEKSALCRARVWGHV